MTQLSGPPTLQAFGGRCRSGRYRAQNDAGASLRRKQAATGANAC
ncbi:MAG: hypothetical protein R3337_10550 [Gammaproteobacteria bacterium]|nr:hypothetical protein [Gammaproteobacteria bacterium]